MPEERKSQPISREIAVVEVEKEPVKSRIIRILFATGGTFTLVLAVLGVFVPGMPCTPFALLSAALFSRSSPKLYNWLLNNRVLGPRIKNYQRRKGISRGGKIKVIILMVTMVLISSFLIVDVPSIRIVILFSGLVGVIVVWFFVPEGTDSGESA